MIRVAIFALFAAPVAADVSIEQHDANAAPFATITLHNHYESGGTQRLLTLDTAHGPVVLRHTITWNSSPDPRDVLTILELPPNVIARPDVLHVEELHKGDIDLFLWEGM